MILSKGKCLIPLPTNRNQDRELTLKIKDLVTIIKELEKEDIQIKFVTYHGEKPYLNFDDSSLIKEFITQHDELLSTVSNIDNAQVDNFDCLIIPSYPYLYEDLKVSDYSLVKLLTQFHSKNKVIMLYEHSTYALCKCKNEDNSWPFVGYNLTGASVTSIMASDLFDTVPVCEEEIMLMGGNFVGKEGNYIAGSLNNELVVCDKNIITGYDVNSLKMCLANLIQKIKI